MSAHPYHGAARTPPLPTAAPDRAAGLAALALALGAGLLLLKEQTVVALVLAALALLVLALSAARRLRRMRAELQAAQAELTRMQPLATAGLATAGFAHELKNGLMVIQGFAELARKAAASTGAAPKVLSHLGEVEAQSGRLVAQLQSFLRLARGEASPVVERPLGEAVAEAARLAEPLVRGRELQFDRAIDAVPEALRGMPVPDPTLREAVLNLLLNAAAHARTGVRLALVERESTVEIAVEDDGPGVAPQIAATLFVPFASARPEGTGLGLWSVQRAAQACGGSVRHEPTASGGARFVIALPRTPTLGARPDPVVGSAHG